VVDRHKCFKETGVSIFRVEGRADMKKQNRIWTVGRGGTYAHIILNNNLPGERRLVDWQRVNRAIYRILNIQRRENFKFQTLILQLFTEFLSI
jgi:hypothetical protein